MKIGLVTVTYNSEHVLVDFLKSVKEQNYNDYCLYVVDNDSKDKTSEILKKNSEIKFLFNAKNFGVAYANNQGVKWALKDGCDFVLLINNDTIFEKELLNKLVDAHFKYKANIVVPKMKYFDSKLIWFAGGFFDAKKAYLNYHRGQGEVDTNQFKDGLVDYAPICCSLMHKSVFEDIGFFDEKYFVYFDDSDFFFRVKKDKIHQTIYIDDVEFYHKIGSLSKSRKQKDKNKYSPFFIQQMTKNHVYFLRKQQSLFSSFLLLYVFVYFMARFFISANYSTDFKTFKLILYSYFNGLKMKI
jgi:GT2 family glycosyltransferase